MSSPSSREQAEQREAELREALERIAENSRAPVGVPHYKWSGERCGDEARDVLSEQTKPDWKYDPELRTVDPPRADEARGEAVTHPPEREASHKETDPQRILREAAITALRGAGATLRKRGWPCELMVDYVPEDRTYEISLRVRLPAMPVPIESQEQTP